MFTRWTPKAADDLSRITRYIRRDNPDVAREVAKTIYDKCESLIHSPLRGRRGNKEGTRELVLSPLPYIATYRIKDTTVEILYIRHGAQVM